jgi:glycosyltransferase involved in cell wall biosynthesis
MNVLVLPSWYPRRETELSGVFIKEQVLHLARRCPQHRFFVARGIFCDREYFLPLRKPISAARAFCAFISARKEVQIREVSSRFFEIRFPVLEWPRWLFRGNEVGMVRGLRKMTRAIRKGFGELSIIHAHVSFPAGYFGALLKEKTGIPLVLTEHMSPFPFRQSNLISRGMITELISRPLADADRIIAVSESHAEEIKKHCDRPIDVIHNFVDHDVFYPREVTNRNETLVFLALGGMVEQKGFDVLLSAIGRMRERNCRFMIGGDGPKLGEYRRLAEDLGVADRVEWLGFVPRESAPRLFRSCDVFVLPSRHESGTIVAREALASGVPVVATRCGGTECVVEGLCGILVDPGDRSGLASAMDVIVRDRYLFDSNRIRQYFMETMSLEVLCSAISKLYSETVAERRIKSRS